MSWGRDEANIGSIGVVTAFGTDTRGRNPVTLPSLLEQRDAAVYRGADQAGPPRRKGDWTDTVAPGTELEVRVKSPETRHTVTVAQLERWCDGVAISPAEVLKRKKVKQLLSR